MTIDEIVDNYKTKSKYGFTNEEIEDIISNNFPIFSREMYNDAMMGNTCMRENDIIINYPWDVKSGLRCGVEDRVQTLEEWD